jgi:branched-chain amino acid aminotransferase
MLDVQLTTSPTPAERRAEILANPGFGQYFTDHMVRADYADGKWGPARVIPYQPLIFDPATTSLHYGQSIFEGLKAYRHMDGSIVAFRPEQNAARFARSAARMAMPPLPDGMFEESLASLVEVDRDWVPDDPNMSLYLRPLMLSTGVGLGVRPADAYAYLLMAGPAAGYFRNGMQPLTVWLCTEYTRAAPGGTGEAKCAGNYAASLVAQAQAAEKGCDQVVWLDAIERRWVEEMGTNNLYFVFGSGPSVRLVTPALTGTLLPGVTRDSLLTLGPDLGYTVEEGKISVEEWRAGCESGELTEVFGCGTAAVVTPVGQVRSAAGDWTVGDGTAGPVANALHDALLSIQTGVDPDRHNWIYPLVKA